MLFFIAHIGTRFLASKADPYLLPVTALLSTLGIVLLYRLNEDLALKQAMWLVVGLVAFLLVLVFVRNLRWLCRFRYVIGVLGLLLLLFTAVSAREINGARLWVDLGPFNFQPGEFGKILLVIFFAAYLVDIREALTVSTHRFLGVPLPPFRYLAPLLTIWALSMALMVFVKDLGTSLLFFGALLALLYAATGRFFYVLVGLVLFMARRDGPLLRLSARADSGGHLARPVEGPEQQGLPDRPVAVRAGRRRPVRPRPGRGISDAAVGRHHHPQPRDRLHLLGHRRGVGAGGRGGHHPPLLDLHLPGLSHRRRRAGRLLPAADHGPHQHLRPAGRS